VDSVSSSMMTQQGSSAGNEPLLYGWSVEPAQGTSTPVLQEYSRVRAILFKEYKYLVLECYIRR
jgi:hypothetical protein